MYCSVVRSVNDDICTHTHTHDFSERKKTFCSTHTQLRVNISGRNTPKLNTMIKKGIPIFCNFHDGGLRSSEKKRNTYEKSFLD